VSTGFSIVFLAGWGSLLMATTIRAFKWLRVRAADKGDGGVGLVRLLLGVSSFLLISQGARLIASLLHYSQTNGILLALFAAGAVLGYRVVRDTQRNIASSRRPSVGDLGRALRIQVALLLLYGFFGLLGAWASPSSPIWGAFALMGFMWLSVTLLLAVWWREGRHGLIRRALIWALLAWTTILIPFFMPWERSRRLLVPAPPECASGEP
jgi:hypothetical protein